MHPEEQREFEGLITENNYLREIIQRLIVQYSEVPPINHQKQENFASQSASNNFHQNYDAKDEKMDFDFRGADDELDGIGIDDLDDPLPKEVTNPKNSPTVHQNTMAEFLMKFNEDVASNVDFNDFMICFDGEQKTIGKYSFPLSLVPTAERIINAYGNVAAECLMNPGVTGKIYIFFCATIKEMEDLELHQVTEKKLFQWRDAIKDALRINFKVEFAMAHLKKIARAYFGRIGGQVLQSIDDKLDALYKERAEAFEGFKHCLADAMDFHGQSVSSGLFP